MGFEVAKGTFFLGGGGFTCCFCQVPCFQSLFFGILLLVLEITELMHKNFKLSGQSVLLQIHHQSLQTIRCCACGKTCDFCLPNIDMCDTEWQTQVESHSAPHGQNTCTSASFNYIDWINGVGKRCNSSCFTCILLNCSVRKSPIPTETCQSWADQFMNPW